jgi:imidazole glycerol-phosphate synthase subunit HisH
MIGIVSTGLSNTTSLRNAIDSLNVKSFLIEEPSQILQADKILLPGVGSFNEAIKRLKQKGLDKSILEAAERGTPILGICLGMQLLADKGYEGGETKGLGLIPGEVKLIDNENLKLPHMGWNNLEYQQSSDILSIGFDNVDYYFIHSYQFIVKYSKHLIATVDYGKQVSAVVAKDNVFGCQFHPEKSQKSGLALLKSFIDNA